jgi:tetratricopeptide (TPR) repeat protein
LLLRSAELIPLRRAVNDEVSQPSQLVELSTVPFPALLFTLLSKRFTGVATLYQIEPFEGERLVWFRGGMPVLTDWQQEGSRLGELAIAQGLVAAAAIDDALAHAQDRLLGEILVERAVLDRPRVLGLLRTQCSRRLVDLFALTEGVVALAACEVDRELQQVNVLDLIHRGVSSRYDVGRVRAELGEAWGASLRATPAFEKYVEHFNFRAEDGSLLGYLGSGGSAELAALGKLPEMSLPRAAQLVCVLWFCRMLEAALPPPASPPALGYAGDPEAFELALAAIEQQLASAADPSLVLEVHNDADSKAIEDAFLRLAARFDPRALPPEVDDQLLARVGAVAEALGTLREAARSRRHALAEFAGLRMVREGKLVRGLALLDEAAALGPVGPHVDVALAWCRLHTTPRGEGDLRRADGTLERLITANPEIPEAHYYRGFTLSGLGKSNDAIGAFRRALALDPQLLDAERQMRALQRGERAVANLAAQRRRLPEGFPQLMPVATGPEHPLMTRSWRRLYWLAGVVVFLMVVANVLLRMDVDFFDF